MDWFSPVAIQDEIHFLFQIGQPISLTKESAFCYPQK